MLAHLGTVGAEHADLTVLDAARRARIQDTCVRRRLLMAPFLKKPVSSTISTPSGSLRCPATQRTRSSANRIDVLSRAADEVLKVRGYDVAGELYQLPLSGLGQPFFRSRLATSPLGYTGARARSSRRPNRGRIRSATRSSSRDHRTTSRSVTCASIPTSWGWAQDYAGLLQKDNCNTDSNLKQRGSDSVTFMPA